RRRPQGLARAAVDVGGAGVDVVLQPDVDLVGVPVDVEPTGRQARRVHHLVEALVVVDEVLGLPHPRVGLVGALRAGDEVVLGPVGGVDVARPLAGPAGDLVGPVDEDGAGLLRLDRDRALAGAAGLDADRLAVDAGQDDDRVAGLGDRGGVVDRAQRAARAPAV